uniref:ARF GTPase-activating protein GIT1-like n=1 Tax=Myxine glutinosa TaxID=7769 RepID=UPI00358EA2BD
MSRKMTRSEVCADCSAPDPGWASINRGVLICDECCSVHRSLGRHISLVKHLRHSHWPPTLLQMVQTLVSNGANSIWEHSLLDPAQVQSGRRKANPMDKVHPTKAEFIKAKYQMLAFVHRLPCRDDDNITTTDLSKQLHSSVRTGNLETSLRLLSLGAQASYFNPDKGSTALHVAAKAGQALQAELLVAHGADPGALDALGQTPVQCARQAGHIELAERLLECQFELTDRLTFYLCGRKPALSLTLYLSLSLYLSLCPPLSLSHFHFQIRRSFFVSSSSPSPSPPITLPIFRTPVTSMDGPDAELAIHSSSGLGIGGEGMRIMGHVGEGEGEIESSSQLPSGQDVIRKTEQITKNIQELLRAAQDGQHDSFVPCSTKIHVAVSEMASLFTKKPRSETLRASLRLMCGSAVRLQSECLKTLPGEPGSQVDLQLITQQVIQCAYDIAKAARQLVTFTTNAAAI